MTDILFVPQDGTLEDAVAKIQPGGIVKIHAGRYMLQETLLIEKPLRFEGEGFEKTVVVSNSNTDLIQVRVNGEFSVEGLCFKYEESTEPSLSDAKNKSLPSILRIKSGIADVSNSKFAGHKKLKSNGISLYGKSRGRIKGNEINNFFSGISSRKDAYSELIGNRCEENLFGIAFIGPGLVADNVCRLNEKTGIIVNGDASPEISCNLCEENDIGIAFFDSSSGAATENVCRLNSGHGIFVTDQASPVISANRCEQNDMGVEFHDSATGAARENVCRLNKSFGIHVSSQASPETSCNLCEENVVGIGFSDTTSGTATENVCRLNERSGIQVKDDASPEIRGNRCEEQVTGISFSGSASGTATENVCRLNKGFGILVRDEASPEIDGNHCEENSAGIGFSDTTSGSATDNVCRFNEKGGIMVGDEASPELSGNHCEENSAGVASSDKTSGLTHGDMIKVQSDQNKIIEFDDNILAWVDESTNLMWEVKNRESLEHMYVWHKRYVKGAPTDGATGSMSYEMEIRDATSYVERLNTNKYAGFSDWRLPMVEELESLIDPDGDNCFIKKPLQKNTSPAYWTDTPTTVVNVCRPKGSSPFHNWKDGAHIAAIKIVDFQKPSTGNYAPNKTLWLRCVRSHRNEEKPSSLSFEEAKKIAKENSGAVITKSPDGTGYIIKNNRSTH